MQKTTIFAGDYERIIRDRTTEELYYMGGNAIYVRQSGGRPDRIYYACKDHLGSIVKLVDGNGTEFFKASYDAWGNRTVTNSAFNFHRGYTGHEHLPEFNLINMNGRLYDPVLARFLSPDPYVQAPEFSQSFNRYSYCLNNPLKYTDPSGEIIWFVPVICFVVYAGIEYGTQVYHNYQASKQMEALGADPMSKKDIWFGEIDWFDVALNGVGGAVSALVPPAAPWIMYGTPVVTNMFDWYGNNTTKSIFDGSIPMEQYLIKTALEEVSLYTTNVIKTGLATPQKDMFNPANHTKYFSDKKPVWGLEDLTTHNLEDMLQQGVASGIDYGIKSTFYPEWNPDKLYKDGVPFIPKIPNVPNTPIKPSYNTEFQRNNKVRSKNQDNNGNSIRDLEKYLRLTLSPLK